MVPRYFFNVYDDQPHLDPAGEVLHDADAAWCEGVKVAGEQIGDLDLKPGQQWRLEITDQAKKPLYVIDSVPIS